MNNNKRIIKRVTKSVLFVFLLFQFFNLSAQEVYPDIQSAVDGQFEKSLKELKRSIIKSDPYGIRFSVMISEMPEGEVKGRLYEDTDIFKNLQLQAKTFISKHNFNEYNFDVPSTEIIESGKYIYAVGIMAELVSNNPAEYSISSLKYTYKTNVNGKVYQYVIHTSAIAITKKPDDGSIVADVYFYDKEGSALLWDMSWGNIMPKIAYTRIGPGNSSSNTKKGANEYRSPDIGGEIAIADVYNPGYYLPTVKFRGCTQEFTNYDKFAEYASVLRLEKSKVHWKYIKTFDDGTVIPESTLKTEAIKAGDLKTFFSKANIIKGKILDSNGNTVKKSIKVVLSPEYSPASFTEQIINSNSDGTYEFKDVESGVYKIYAAGNKGDVKRIEVCNCPKKQETQNFTYEIDVKHKPVLYSVTAEYNYPKMVKVKYRWDNVSIGFPEDLSVLPPEIDQTNNEVTEMYDLKPPFSVNVKDYGKFGFYSTIPEENDNGYVVSKEILNENFATCTVDAGSFAIKKVAIESPYIYAFLDFNIELNTDDSQTFLLIPMAVGCLNDDGPWTFKWNKLDEHIITKLNNGESAVKTLTNKGGASITIKFEPQ